MTCCIVPSAVQTPEANTLFILSPFLKDTSIEYVLTCSVLYLQEINQPFSKTCSLSIKVPFGSKQ